MTLYKENAPSTNGRSGHSTAGVPSGGGSLGFNIVGGDGADGIYVSHIHPDRPAARSKGVSVGDRLIMVSQQLHLHSSVLGLPLPGVDS